jgi:hypothetical protein
MTDIEPPSGGLTAVTVNLTERAMTALNETADRLGDTRTDTINRAIQLYAVTTALAPGQGAQFNRVDGEQVTLRRMDGRGPVRVAFVLVAALGALVAFGLGVAVAL